MTSVYVAGSSAERPVIAGYLARLVEVGYTITHDWTTHEGFDVPPPGPPEAVLVEAARVDLDAVTWADVVWYVTPAPASGKSEGAAAELGAALVLATLRDKLVVVSGHLDRQRIFPRLAPHHYETHEEAFAFLEAYACGRGLKTLSENNAALQQRVDTLDVRGRGYRRDTLASPLVSPTDAVQAEAPAHGTSPCGSACWLLDGNDPACSLTDQGRPPPSERHTALDGTCRQLSVYISSSWKNRDRVRALAVELRAHGHSVYDFTDPVSRGVPEIPPERFPNTFDPGCHDYATYLNDTPEWRAAVEGNRKALAACDAAVLLLPCGNDAHADWAYAVGAGKRTCVVGAPKTGERTPTHLWADAMLWGDGNVVGWLAAIKGGGS